MMTKRVEHMEVSITNIVSRIDSVLSKMEAMERAKAARREALDKLLQTLTQAGEGASAGGDFQRGEIERMVQAELEGIDSATLGPGSRPGTSGAKSLGKGMA